KPSLRHGDAPLASVGGVFNMAKGLRPKPSRDLVHQMEEPGREVSVIGSLPESYVGPVIEQPAENGEGLHTEAPQTACTAEVSPLGELTEFAAITPQAPVEIPESVEEIAWPTRDASDMFDGAKEPPSFEEELAETPHDEEIALPVATALTELPVESISVKQSV